MIMEIFLPFIIFSITIMLACILLSVCECCKRKREGTVFGLSGTVSTQPISASRVVVPPYPLKPRHPTPGAVSLGPGFATHHPPYPKHTPHPVPGAAPYTSSTGPVLDPLVGVTPYSPTGPPLITSPFPDYSAEPPSYAEAVSQSSLSTKASYNPNY